MDNAPDKISLYVSNKIANMSLFCALLVVLIHVDAPSRSSQTWWIVHYVLRFILATIAVPFFFVVSGFFLARHCNESHWWRSAIFKRLKTVYVPFLLTSLLMALFVFFVQIPLSQLCDGKSIAFDASWFARANVFGLDLMHGTVCPPLWYLRMLMLLVLASPVIVWMLRKFGFCVLVVLFMLYYIVNPGHIEGGDYWLDLRWLDFWRRGISLEGLFYFSFGCWLANRSDIGRISHLTAAALGTIGLVLGVTRMVYLLAERVPPVHFVALSIPFVLVFVWHYMPDIRLKEGITTMSFPIYLLHTFALLVVIPAVRAAKISGGLVEWLLGVAMTMWAVVVLRRFFPRFASLLFGGR